MRGSASGAIKKLNSGVEVCIHRLAFGDRVAFTEVPDMVGEEGFLTIDLPLNLADRA